MTGQHQITITEVANDLSFSFGQGSVAVHLAPAGVFRMVEKVDPGVFMLQLLYGITSGVIEPVTDNEDFNIGDRLALDASYGER